MRHCGFRMNTSNHLIEPSKYCSRCFRKKFNVIPGGLLKCEVRARLSTPGNPGNENMPCILKTSTSAVASSRHKNHNEGWSQGDTLPGGAYPRCARRRQIDVDGNALTRVTNFALYQAERAKVCLKIGRKIWTRHLKPTNLTWLV